MKSAVFLLVLISVAACGRPQNSAVAPAAGDAPATATSAPALSASGDNPTTTDLTTPDQAAALAGNNSQNMKSAEDYLATHPAARTRRHVICDRVSDMDSGLPRSIAIYCSELRAADLDAQIHAPSGVDDTKHF
jgi:hypothetical protein